MFDRVKAAASDLTGHDALSCGFLAVAGTVAAGTPIGLGVLAGGVATNFETYRDLRRGARDQAPESA